MISFASLCRSARFILLPLLFTSAVQAQEVLTVGLIPSEDSQAMIKSSQLVLDQLEQRLGMPVKPFVATDYNGVIEALRAGKLDVAYLGPFSYVLAKQMADAEAFAVAVTRKTGSSTYHSLIIARNDGGIRSLQDLQGKTFAFVDPSSASGHLFPKAGLEQAGRDPKTLFSRVVFSGSHDASILAVENRKVDAAAVADRILASAVHNGQVKQQDFHVLWTSPDIPESPMVWRKGLDPELQAKLRDAFAAIRDVPWGDQGMLDGFQPTSDAAYDVVRDTAKVLDLDLRRLK